MRKKRLAIIWQAATPTFQQMATRPLRDFRVRENALDNGFEFVADFLRIANNDSITQVLSTDFYKKNYTVCYKFP